VGYSNLSHVRLLFDDDETARTLEPQLLKWNGRVRVNLILGQSFDLDADLLKYMEDNKTESALKFFETKTEWTVPEYISRAIA
jgi:hypothetical protein